MSMQDPIADLLTRIRNAQKAAHAVVRIPHSKVKAAICGVLEQEGYIEGFSVSEGDKRELTVELRYHDGAGVIEDLHRVSRPGASGCTGHTPTSPGCAAAWALPSSAPARASWRIAPPAASGSAAKCSVRCSSVSSCEQSGRSPRGRRGEAGRVQPDGDRRERRPRVRCPPRRGDSAGASGAWNSSPAAAGSRPGRLRVRPARWSATWSRE